MDDIARQRYKSIVAEDIKRHRPDNAHIAEAIVDRLFDLHQMQDEASVQMFISSYKKALERGVGNGIQ